MIRLFVGQDDREAVGLPVFCSSVWRLASEPVSITALGANVARTDGTNAFTLARFEIPRLCNYEGWALWMDGTDMLMVCDIAELWALRDPKYAVQVVKHDYKPRAARKYIGTRMEADNAAYPRKNWSSVMLLNNERWRWPNAQTGSELHRFSRFADEEIGELPKCYNFIIDEDNQCKAPAAKIMHWSNGGPWFPYYGDTLFASLWRDEYKRMLNGP